MKYLPELLSLSERLVLYAERYHFSGGFDDRAAIDTEVIVYVKKNLHIGR